MDLIVIPVRVVLSDKLMQEDKIEIKGRADQQATIIAIQDLLENVKN